MLYLWKYSGIVYKLTSTVFLFADGDMLSVFEAKLGNQASSFLHILALYLFPLLIMCFSYIYSIFFWNYTLKLRYYHLEE